VETAPGNLIFTITQNPTHGMLSGSGANRTYTPFANYSGPDSFQYTVTDTGDGTAATLTSDAATVSITITPVGDTPTLTVTPAAGVQGAAIPLSIQAVLTDTDGSETLSITISGVPAGASLSAGVNQGGGVWLLTPAQLAGLTLTVADPGPITLQV